MPLIRPFPGLRPTVGRDTDVVSPPYDVMNEAEARAMVQGRPWSFLHVSRAEVDLPEGTDPYASEVYAKAAENLRQMCEKEVLRQDAEDCFYVYRLTKGDQVQTGLVAAASVEAYNQDRIKKHEFTRPAKEDDRVRQIDALNAQTGPVFLVYKADPEVDALLADIANVQPDADIRGDDGVRHQLWVVADQGINHRLQQAFEQMEALYVADGHHRSAAASRVAAVRKAANSSHTGEEAYNYFLTVIFPHDQVKILDYNRVVRDLGVLDREGFLVEVEKRFSVSPSAERVRPRASGEFGMYLPGQWYRLNLDYDKIPDDPVARLDVSLLTDNLLQAVLDIRDQKRDDRIDFVGGIRGLRELERRVDNGEMAVAFALFPTSMEALIGVADAGQIMPPKSTWFEPKLVDGLVSHMLGEEG